MAQKYLIKNARLVNEGKQWNSDLLIEDGRIAKIQNVIDAPGAKEINAEGRFLIPGLIDDQVHFREPGLTQKACIYTESKAALMGGVTSYMEMPNTKPTATTQEKLEYKYQLAAAASWVNYSFFMGATNDNLDEVLKTPVENVCGVKIFMGSSTGNMLVDDPTTLGKIFANSPKLIAVHCEDEQTIRSNEKKFKAELGNAIDASYHPLIRSAEGCYRSSSEAVMLAKAHGTRLHILHISTAKELDLFDDDIPLLDKKITAEACVHHLYFDDSFYLTEGNFIKCNPAIKTKADRDAIRDAVLSGKIDVIATDHAPHTWREKMLDYWHAPSGLPLVQHSLHVLLSFVQEGWLTMEKLVEKTAHAPQQLFGIVDRGYLREGYHADLVLLDPATTYIPQDHFLYSQVNWTPFKGMQLNGKVTDVWINGVHKVEEGNLIGLPGAHRLKFTR